MPAHMVNAYYNPQKNLIVFPAAILQAHSMTHCRLPTTVVLRCYWAHEISHAFDTNGAL